jgi:alkanesulfonate monooxygenase SsuD/methylene tetrahydromethanopterin reductase-like flavin-dependent oxidoreductase (luciferase family)
MRYGFILPGGDARTAATLAYEAEQAGWDGFFVLNPVWGIDPWVSLAAAAMQTKHIRLGPVLTPVSRIKPWQLASATATLDNLSHGRVILSVGLGDIDELEPFGEITDRKIRAELLDEGLDILTGLWRGQPLSYTGKHYKINTRFSPPPAPLQQPRIPIWVVGAWPSKKSMHRALRYDGLLPQVLKPAGGKDSHAQNVDLADLHTIRAFIAEHHSDPMSFDIIVEGDSPGDDQQEAAELVAQWEEAGATWWLEAPWDADTQADVAKRIRQGPPNTSTPKQ